MTDPGRRRADLGGLIGSSEASLRERFGAPTGRVADGSAVWLVFHVPAGRLRVRCRPGRTAGFVVASWTLRFDFGFPTLAEAARAAGLWPAAGPDVTADAIDAPLVRRAMPRPDGPMESLTATVRGDLFTHLSMFDEPPDWL